MNKITGIVFVVFILAVFGSGVSRAQYGGDESSMTSGDSEAGWEEMQEMSDEMDVHYGDSDSSIEDKGMDVQPGDSIDSEGTGAH